MEQASQQQASQQQAQHILDEVYGPCMAADSWVPRPFEPSADPAARRYLWTDAFGVCAYLSLYHATKDDRLLQQALALVEDVHNTLGHQRWVDQQQQQQVVMPAAAPAGDSSSSSSIAPPWLRGADAQHPTRAGLRIGKPHPEGHPDGDGQYYHYLTKWAFALCQVAAATHDPKYLRWAIELMQTAHKAFTYKTSGGAKRMYWKLSIDLSHPTVTSMGNLDPYDGLVTCTLLQQAAAATAAAVVSDAAHSQVQEQVQHHGDDGVGGGQGLSAGRDQQQGFTGRVLQAEIADLQAMVDARYMSYQSDEPLDLGEALWLSHWQLGDGGGGGGGSGGGVAAAGGGSTAAAAGGGGAAAAAWAKHVSAVSLSSLDELWAGGYFDQQPLRWRLGFREFGTSIGLQALLATQPGLRDAAVWRQRVQQIHDTWGQQLYTRDRDITPVMYATSLVPGVWIRRLQ